MRIVLFNV